MSDIDDLVDSVMGDAHKDLGSLSLEKSDISVMELDREEMPDELLDNWPVKNDGSGSFNPKVSRSSMGSGEISLLSYVGRLPPLKASGQTSPLKPIARPTYDDDVDSCVGTVVRDEEFRLISQKPTTEYVTLKLDPDRYKKKGILQDPPLVFLDGKGTIKPLSELNQMEAAAKCANMLPSMSDSTSRPDTRNMTTRNTHTNSRGSEFSLEEEDVGAGDAENENLDEVEGEYGDDEEVTPPMIDVRKLREEFKRQYLLALEKQSTVKLKARVLSYEKPEAKVELSAAQRAKLIGEKNREIDEQNRLKDLKAKEKRRRKNGKKSSESGQNKLKITIAYCVGGPGSVGVSSSHKLSQVHSPLKNISKSIQFQEDTSLRSSSPVKREAAVEDPNRINRMPFK